ncbi:cyclase family protein [Prauserella cavernicola]|uniref:Cyclase family protein n=1 Tax=Prauserella cavernicola TaxID=2800127 RepID=A0A934V6F6_9PSEU|nr:cyclase family protein [Prauserella cavernicola]MBK1787482.1 cyclase family protein [Prauserella cavernicola]
MTLVDLSHPIWPGMPKIPVLPDVELDAVSRISAGAPMNISALRLALHVGTHIDAPSHVVDGGASIDELPLDRFDRHAVVTSVRRGPGEEITVADILDGGPAPQPGDFLLLHTGWGEKFGSAGYDDFPSLSPDAADWAVREGVSLVGSDTLTPDLPVSRRDTGFTFPVHRTLLGNDVLIGENLRNLGAVAGRRVHVHALPLAVHRGDAGPSRIVADV